MATNILVRVASPFVGVPPGLLALGTLTLVLAITADIAMIALTIIALDAVATARNNICGSQNEPPLN